MKRNLLILAVLAILAGLIFCCPAMADEHYFVQQPQSGPISPDTLTFTVSWQTNFVPLKVEVMHCEYEYGPGHDYFGNDVTTLQERRIRVYTLTTDMQAGRSFEFAAIRGENYRLHAYYGTGSGDFVPSDIFTANASLLCFTEQPQSGSYSPESRKFEASWVTSFKPVRLEIMRCTQKEKTDTWFNSSYTYTVTEKTHVCDIGGLMSPGYTYPFEPEPYDHYCVRAYFSRDDAVDSEEFYATLSDLKFITAPQDGSLEPETLKYTARWETSFSPVMVEIVSVVNHPEYEDVYYGKQKLFTITHNHYEYNVVATMKVPPRNYYRSFVPLVSSYSQGTLLTRFGLITMMTTISCPPPSE